MSGNQSTDGKYQVFIYNASQHRATADQMTREAGQLPDLTSNKRKTYFSTCMAIHAETGELVEYNKLLKFNHKPNPAEIQGHLEPDDVLSGEGEAAKFKLVRDFDGADNDGVMFVLRKDPSLAEYIINPAMAGRIASQRAPR